MFSRKTDQGRNYGGGFRKGDWSHILSSFKTITSAINSSNLSGIQSGRIPGRLEYLGQQGRPKSNDKIN